MKVEFILPRHTKHQKMYRIGPISLALPSLTLSSLATCVPDDINVQITDEHVDTVKLCDNDADIIGINTRSQTAFRAYYLADQFRKQGKIVILGGIHASILPEEAINHADAVVIGEAEGLFEKVIEDVKKNKLKEIYRHEKQPNLKDLLIPDRSYLYEQKHKYAPVDLVMVSRGCPHSCSFCYMESFNGRNYRLRMIDDVVEEVKNLRNRLIFFVDDNLAANSRHALELFNRLIPFRKKWVGQATISITDSPELLSTLSKSGCRCLFIGFESINQQNLDDAGKKINKMKRYKERIKRLHDHGIMVYGGFILGFNRDTKDIFAQTTEFATEAKIDMAHFHCIDPYPKTKVYYDMLKKNQLIQKKWWLSEDFPKVRYYPENMSCEELHEGILSCYNQFYSKNSFFKRFSKRHLSDYLQFLLYIVANLMFKNNKVPWILN